MNLNSNMIILKVEELEILIKNKLFKFQYDNT